MRRRRIADSSDSDDSSQHRNTSTHRRFHNERPEDPVHDDYSPSKMLARRGAREQQDKEMRARVAQETSERMENGVNIDPRLSAIL